MTDDFTTPDEPSTATKIVDGIQAASIALNDAIETGRQPGIPLDVLAKAVREAPLAALGIAFLIGYAFVKPRR